MSSIATGEETHPELAAEQALLDYAYSCLDRMRRRAEELKSLGYLGGNVTEGGVEVHDVQQWERHWQRRVDLLTDGPGTLCFGRIDRSALEHCYIGRRHVEDENGEPLVADWRAPVAIPFYRATVADPMGLSRRRRFLVEARQIVDLFDENLANPSGVDAGAYVPDPLLAEVARGRTGQMRDIVATIQAEQDVIIRAPLDRCIVVQGGPGTGKTAVGLHRAAYLLYEHRAMLERERLLIVGPNRIFLRYISQVLPSLGEVAATQVTLEGVAGARHRLGESDASDVARLKGDTRMAEVVRRAVVDQMRAPTADVRIPTSFGSVTLRADEIAAVVTNALRQTKRFNDGRHLARERLVKLAWTTHASKLTTNVTRQDVFEADVRSSTEFKTLLNKTWPTVSAQGALRRLYGNRSFRAGATHGILGPEEASLLARAGAKRMTDQRWSRADLALLDEAEDLISGTKEAYGHIVVDEAQDLSAMELRMLGRRSIRGSMTVLGDLAQSTAPGGQTDWREAISNMHSGKSELNELTVGYRVPEPIMIFANRLLPHAAPGLRPPSSVRQVGAAPTIIAVAPKQLAAATAAESRAVASRWPLTAVVVPDSIRTDVSSALRAADVDFVDGASAAELGEHVTVLPPSSTKGLEFDAVVVVEPAEIVAEGEGDLRLLYVVLTRAVQHLSVVRAAPLPGALTG
jgi:DNA helicase IV